MKPSRFAYLAPRDLTEVTAALEQHGEEAKLLAGGQSLGPLLNLRLANPTVLIDLNHVSELGVDPTEDSGFVSIAAMSRQHVVEVNDTVATHCPLVTQALPFVAHRTIRHRGTVGGSIAHADPASELPTVAVASEAILVARGTAGLRNVGAEDFFQGHFTTALRADETLVAVRFPKQPKRTGHCWVEFAPRRGDYAIVGVAARLRLDQNGCIASPRLVYSGVSDVPWREAEIDRVLAGERPSAEVFDGAADLAAALCEPSADLVGSVAYRRNLVRHLTVQALRGARERALGAADATL